MQKDFDAEKSDLSKQLQSSQSELGRAQAQLKSLEGKATAFWGQMLIDFCVPTIEIRETTNWKF